MAFTTKPKASQRYKPMQTKGFGAKASLKPLAKPGLGGSGVEGSPGKGAKPKPVGRAAQPDSIYNSQVDLASRQGESRLTSLEGQETAVKHDFGIDDPTNPFSRAEGLKRAFLAKYKGVSAGLAAQGHLYSGSHERALSRTRLEEEQARSDLRSAYESALGSIQDARAATKFQTEEQQNQAFEDWLARAPESEGSEVGPTPLPQRGAGPTSGPLGAPSIPKAPSGAGRSGSAGGDSLAPSLKPTNLPKTPGSGDKINTLRTRYKAAVKAGNKTKVRQLRRQIHQLGGSVK